ncbi:MAG TPA: cupredoxin domain-containing protein [Candidatus Eremiobacteraceae bacterium]|nr:cupredoxin domain-containing protein [Candidatus Eremiobacteraceae bacterium]
MRNFMKAAPLAAIIIAIAVFTGASRPAAVNVVATTWSFTPSTIHLKLNQPAELSLTSNNATHGLQSDDLGIPLTLITPGKTVTVDVTPHKAGTFTLHCANYCGAGHPNMALTVVVAP